MTKVSAGFPFLLLVRLLAWSMVLFASLASTAARAAAPSSYVFNGAKVNGCQLDTSTYTCNNFPLSNDTDKMTIANGYTVIVKSSVVFTFNQSLTMSGSATLNVTGNLSIGDINPPNLSITGGTLISSGTFTIGNQAQSITADISAVTMTLGAGSRTSITGDVTASGNITMGSYCTINGSVSGAGVTTNSPVTITGDVSATKSFALASGSKVSGNITAPIVTTDSPVTIVGNVTASTSFTLASGSKVSGDIVSPTVSLLASQSTVTGKITARNSLQLGDKVNVTGDVTAGNLILEDASAIVNGNATVDRATLNWAGRVTKTIYCTGGTTNGQCDCVTNNSGFPVNTAQGPHCAAVQPPPRIDHFLILHDGSASACTPEPVTVKACANAGCTSLYTGSVNVTLQPGGNTFSIGASGVSTNATVSQASLGTAALSVSAASTAAANPLQCDNTSDSSGPGSANCSINFNNSIGLSLAMQDQYAATSTPFTLKATVFDPKTNTCPAAYAGQTKTVRLSCTYRNPARGSQPIRVAAGAQASAASTALNAANASAGTCDGSNRDFNVSFASDGTVPFSMYYGDVGLVGINASMPDNGVSGTSGSVVVAPAAFQITSVQTPTIAGVPFKVIVTSLNAEGKATLNFGQETVPETVKFSLGALDATGCKLKATDLGVLDPAPTTSVVGTGTLGNITYTEAGALNIQAEQASAAYLGGAKPRPAAVRTSTTSGCGAISSVPAYFQVNESRVGKANFYYAGEPVDVTVTAMNAQGKITTLYDKGFGYSKPVSFTAFDAAGTTSIPDTSGRLSGTGATTANPLPASAFARGVASQDASAPAPLVFTFASSPGRPLKVRLRASETASGGVSSQKAGDYGKAGEDIYEARSGRVTIGSRFGSAKGDLVLPVTLQYWTGASWVQNLNDNDLHSIPASAFAIQATAPLLKPAIGTNGIDAGRQVLVITNGAGSLTLRPAGGTGTATVAINLGAGATDNACLPTPPARPATSGAKMPWLRGPNGICVAAAAATADPAARATFGVYSPEARRLIHTREVFN